MLSFTHLALPSVTLVNALKILRSVKSYDIETYLTLTTNLVFPPGRCLPIEWECA